MLFPIYSPALPLVHTYYGTLNEILFVSSETIYVLTFVIIYLDKQPFNAIIQMWSLDKHTVLQWRQQEIRKSNLFFF